MEKERKREKEWRHKKKHQNDHGKQANTNETVSDCSVKVEKSGENTFKGYYTGEGYYLTKYSERDNTKYYWNGKK